MGYLRFMEPTGTRRWNALLLLAVMVFFSAPRAWFHQCDAPGLHTSPNGCVVIHTDDHCPVCEGVQAPLLADITVLVVLRSDVAVGLIFASVSGAATDRAVRCFSRGPPLLV
jgi:hypothetical protein